MSNTPITARVTDQTVQLVNTPQLASGSAGVLQIVCTFDSLWDGYTKTAVFYRSKEQVYHVLMVDGVATIPSEVLTDEGYFYFGVMGTAENTRTTEVVRMTLEQGAITMATANSDLTPDIYQQILSAVALERARMDELVAMRSETGAFDAALSDEYINGTIRHNGAAAYIKFDITDLSLVAGGHHYTDFCIVPGLGPLGPVELRTSNPDINVTVETPNAAGWARMLIENVGTAMYTTDMVTSCEAFYPLASVYNSELADIRIGSDGTAHDTAGGAVREQVNALGERMVEWRTASVNPYGMTVKADNFSSLLPSMDTAEPNKIYSVLKTSAMTIANWPEGVGYATFVTLTPLISSDTYKVQLIFDVAKNKALFRTCVGGVWNTWSTLGTFEEVAEVLSVSVNPYGQRIKPANWDSTLFNMDIAEPNKIYSVLKTSTMAIANWPKGVGYATFVTFTPEIGTDTFKVQLLFDVEKNKALFRTCVGQVWAGWKPVGEHSVVYVAPNGDDSADGSKANPFATFNKAISSGANTIIAEPGTYAQTVSISGVNNLTIRAQKKEYSGTFQDALNPKIIFDTSERLNLEDSGLPGIGRCAYTAELTSRLYKVFVSKELPVLDGSASESIGYNANLWEIREDGSLVDDVKLVPVLTQAECVATEKTFFYDGEYILVHPSGGDLTGKKYMLPSDDDTIFNVQNCDNLVLEDVQTEHGYTLGINVEHCRNAVLTDCNAHHSAAGGGFRLNYTNGRLSHCKAYKNRNDGFNMHQNGYTELINCYALYNEDDGVSHHQGCSGTVIGGEYSYNGSGGVTPAFGAEVNVYNAIMRGNLYGLQVLGASGYANRTMIAMNNIMTQNIKGGLYVKKNTVIGMNTIYGNTENQIVRDTAGVYVDLTENT